jgi:hypothetical protein
MIGNNVDTFLKVFMGPVMPTAIEPEAYAEYRRCFSDPATLSFSRHAPAQWADGLVGHGGASVLSEVLEHLDLRTGRFHPLRLLIIARAAPQAPYCERFSPVAQLGHCGNYTANQR